MAIAVLVITGVVAYRVNRAWEDHAALQAQYDKTLANWRPHGPADPWLRTVNRVRPVVAILAFAPQDGFPQTVPWVALALNKP